MGTNAPRKKPVRWKTRTAKPGDAKEIWRLLNELAEYERMSDLVTGSAKKLSKHIAGKTEPRVYARVAEADGKLVGYTLTFKAFSSFRAAPMLWLEDLYVSPAYRRLGIGDAFLREAARLTMKHKCAKLEWWVLAWNKPALDFYKSIGATGDGDERAWRLQGAALKRFAKGR